MKIKSVFFTFLLLSLPFAKLQSFSGFYVAKNNTKLFNKASQVVFVRKENKTVLTMASDYQGDLKEFAIVIPVPTLITKEQIHIVDKALLDHLDLYTSPRFVEYFDSNPCQKIEPSAKKGTLMKPKTQNNNGRSAARAQSLGVKIEAPSTVGEYDILILSAKESSGLETWLKEHGYKIPEGISRILESYLRQNMKFLVAKVNLKEQSKLGFSFLRPLQIAYESSQFMLPLRLGTVNASGSQELFIYALSSKGRVESANYRSLKIPTGMDLPLYIKDEFKKFYHSMFSEQIKKEGIKTLFTEYASDRAGCDSCAANFLSKEELKNLGVFWLDEMNHPQGGGAVRLNMRSVMPSSNLNTFITRLHVRYDREHFLEDLVFRETADRTDFQGRYVLRHPWTGRDSCPAALDYRKKLSKRLDEEAQNLAKLTGGNVNEIRQKMISKILN